MKGRAPSQTKMLGSERPRRLPARIFGTASFRVLVLLNLAAFGLARLTGFARESVIADLFGTSRRTDAYVAATALPEVVAGVFLAGLVGYAVIPRLVSYEQQGERDKADQLLGAALSQVLLWCGGFALIGLLFPGLVLRIVAPGLSAVARGDAELMLRIASPSIVFFGLAGLGAAMLNASHRFVSIPISLVLGNLAALAMLGTAHWIGIEAAAAAYLVAAVLTACTQWAIILRGGFGRRIRIGLRNPQTRAVLGTAGLATLVVGIPYARYLMERAMASTRGAGDLAALGFAGRTIFFFGAVIAVPVGMIAFPRLAEHVVGAEWGELMTTLRRAISFTLVVSVPAALVLTVFGRDVVRLLFEHGAFGESSTSVTTSILRIYALALIPMALIEILLRAFFALNRQRAALGFLAFSFAVNVGLNFWLLGRVGVKAVAIGAAVAIWTGFLLMGGYLLRVMRGLETVDSASSATI
jgi:putative peptidoglycan lipid II flippase